MIKLNYIIPRNGFVSAREYWSIDNDISVRITRFNGYALIRISSLTGDIADQIYNEVKYIDNFSDLQLEVADSYIIFVPLKKLEDLLQFIEKINRSKLKEGHRY